MEHILILVLRHGGAGGQGAVDLRRERSELRFGDVTEV